LPAQSVTDTTGMGLYDSGARAFVSPFAYTFTAAGDYPYRSTTTGITAAYKILPFAPRTGATGMPFTVRWASATQPRASGSTSATAPRRIHLPDMASRHDSAVRRIHPTRRGHLHLPSTTGRHQHHPHDHLRLVRHHSRQHLLTKAKKKCSRSRLAGGCRCSRDAVNPVGVLVGADRAMRLRIRARFLLAVSLLVPAVLALAWTAERGLGDLNTSVNDLYGRNIVSGQLAGDVGTKLDRVDEAAIQALASRRPSDQQRLATATQTVYAPAVDVALDEFVRVTANDTSQERRNASELVSCWAAFRRAWLGQVLTTRSAVQRQRAIPAFQAAFSSVAALSDDLARLEASNARRSAAQASRTHEASLWRVYEISAVTLLLALGVAVWLAWTIVPRARLYSHFAARVAAGETPNTLDVRGQDELADLGQALNQMVVDRAAIDFRSGRQTEFAEAIQLAEDEGEANEVLKLHLERSVPDSSAVVLNRNNSEDRLEATTPIPQGSPLPAALEGAGPRDCLAVRFARAHTSGIRDTPLLACSVCHALPGQTMCQPLLVGGEVIGSVLTSCPTLRDSDVAQISESVTQAAPILANLRNLAIAEVRAATDALTGLPNSRAVRDTARRMVAEATRGGRPLSALLMDLDHFKNINDTYGHAPGDDVLAAVGDALRSTVRESDFPGRYGGEEFLILLPDTDLKFALAVAEKIRLAIATIRVSTVGQLMTASVGVATLPDHGHDTQTLLRAADRALYTAKANGRNLVETLPTDPKSATSKEAAAA
jgi:diguanylate cyclase (GGDEF)-like protein